jgi:hypothetical protein
MPKWNVLMTTEGYVEVEADTPKDAEMEALRMYQRCEIRPEYPIFVCEEADLVEGWEIRYDDSGESERYGEGRWFVADETGMVLGDASFHTKQEAEDFLKECLENGDA